MSTLPLIDLSDARPDTVARHLDDACREFGFFHLIGHGIERERIARLEALAREFFAWDEERKLRIRMALGGRAWRGYFPVGGELTSGRPDWKEGLYFGTELDEQDERVRRGVPLHGRNLFPEITGFREAVLDYIAASSAVAQRLLEIIALGLGLPRRFFREHYTADPTVLFRIFNYPSRPHVDDADWGVGEHTDYGLITLLHQDRMGGLQVRHGEGWIDVPYLPDAFVCNVGDMLERLTRGRYLSALHRARNPSDCERLSLVFFFDPSFDAPLQPLPNVGPLQAAHTNVRWDHIDPNTAQGTYGDYLLSKVSKVFPQLKAEVLSA